MLFIRLSNPILQCRSYFLLERERHQNHSCFTLLTDDLVRKILFQTFNIPLYYVSTFLNYDYSLSAHKGDSLVEKMRKLFHFFLLRPLKCLSPSPQDHTWRVYYENIKGGTYALHWESQAYESSERTCRSPHFLKPRGSGTSEINIYLADLLIRS
jgi:hypothetical protein